MYMLFTKPFQKQKIESCTVKKMKFFKIIATCMVMTMLLSMTAVSEPLTANA